VLVAGERRLIRVTDGKVASRRSTGGTPIALAVGPHAVWVATDRLLRFER
jgi:hypothetical protein